MTEVWDGLEQDILFISNTCCQLAGIEACLRNNNRISLCHTTQSAAHWTFFFSPQKTSSV